MKETAHQVLLVPPDVPGFLAAGAWLRRTGPGSEIQVVAPHEVTRRIFGLAAEQEKRQITVADLVPMDSVDSLLVHALRTFSEAGLRVRFVYGDRGLPDPPAVVMELAEVRRETGPVWRLFAGVEDRKFSAFGDAFEGGTHRIEWIKYLQALATSWDWSRIYRALGRLAALEHLDAEDSGWAERQLQEVARCRAVVGTAPVRNVDGFSIVVVIAPVMAVVRPEVLAEVRAEHDAVILSGGPNRLVMLGTKPEVDLSQIPTLRELAQATGESGLVVHISDGRAEVGWPPGDVPSPVERLLGDALSAELADLDSPAATAKIQHPEGQRTAKGIRPDELHPHDRVRIASALGGDTVTREGAAQPTSVGARTPAQHNDIEIAPRTTGSS
ncbi:MAG TPA: hypothetical protein VHJ78_01885 [Actinomycetota bacterium]|nr:hypothetical protein [Actinomycetota bacterium]